MTQSTESREQWILDATFADDMEENGVFAFCPADLHDDGTVKSVTFGMTYISDEPPRDGVFVGVIHSSGQAACDAWCEAHDEFLQALRVRRGRSS